MPTIDYTDAELMASLEEGIAAAGRNEPAIRESIEGFADGINAWVSERAFPSELMHLVVG